MSATRARSRPRLAGRPRLRPRLRARLAVGAILVAGVLLGAWLWVRDSSLVGVQRVQVIGAEGPDGAAIRSALITAARTMTTLDVSVSELRTAVEPFPVVKHLSVSTQFPHGMRIHVTEQIPVAVVESGARSVTVAGDGTVLRDAAATESLPVIRMAVPPGGGRLTGAALLEARLAAAAPFALLPKVQGLDDDAEHGLAAQLRHGPVIYFGDAGDLAAKWGAAAQALADPLSAGASYIDVTDPARPAAGTGSDASARTSNPSAGGSTTPSGSTAATGAAAPSGSTAPGG